MQAADDSTGAATLAIGVASAAQTAVKANKRSEFMAGAGMRGDADIAAPHARLNSTRRSLSSSTT
jgi:hypothetical protein